MKNRTILLAEDTEELRELMGAALERAGYSVILATNGMQAIRLWTQHPEIEAVVTDLEMPLLNGIQLTQLIEGKLPVIMWSGSTNPNCPGVNAFIHKIDGSKPVIKMLDALLNMKEVA